MKARIGVRQIAKGDNVKASKSKSMGIQPCRVPIEDRADKSLDVPKLRVRSKNKTNHDMTLTSFNELQTEAVVEGLLGGPGI
jgi:hypothetical protein